MLFWDGTSLLLAQGPVRLKRLFQRNFGPKAEIKAVVVPLAPHVADLASVFPLELIEELLDAGHCSLLAQAMWHGYVNWHHF